MACSVNRTHIHIIKYTGIYLVYSCITPHLRCLLLLAAYNLISFHQQVGLAQQLIGCSLSFILTFFLFNFLDFKF